jgi:ABC-2 type transport system permease protein
MSTLTRELRGFTTAHARELIRNRSAVVAILVSFMFVLALLSGLDLLLSTATSSSVKLVRTSLGLVSATGFMAVAFVATAVPLVRYRSVGTLRHLSTTPARRATFLLGHVPIRGVIIGLQSVIIVAVAIGEGAAVGVAMSLALTLLVGGAMLLSFGYLLASRMANMDLALQLAYIIPLIVLITSGALFPLSIYPDAVENLFQIMPTTWFVNLLNAQVNGVEPLLPTGVMWAMMALTTVGAGYLAWRTYRWEPAT